MKSAMQSTFSKASGLSYKQCRQQVDAGLLQGSEHSFHKSTVQEQATSDLSDLINGILRIIPRLFHSSEMQLF